MSTTVTWAVANLERNTADGAVFTVHYTVAASDDTYVTSAYGSIGLEQPDPESMIPYADLTPELVIGWVQEKLGGDEKVAEIEAALQTQLNEQHAPTKASGLPWQ